MWGVNSGHCAIGTVFASLARPGSEPQPAPCAPLAFVTDRLTLEPHVNAMKKQMLSAVALLALVGCSETTQDKAKDAADAVGDAATSAAADTVENVRAAGEKIGDAVDNAGDEIEEEADEAQAELSEEAREAEAEVNEQLDEIERANDQPADTTPAE